MKVYIEYVLLGNFIIDFILLKTAYYITNKKPKTKRIIFSAVVGSVVSLIIPLVEQFAVIKIIIKFNLGIIMILLSTNDNNIKSIALSYIVFLISTFVFGGLVIAFYEFLGITTGTEFCAISCVIVIVCAYKTVRAFVKKSIESIKIKNFNYKIKIKINGTENTVISFLDSGDNVFYNGCPVCFISYETIKDLDLSNIWEGETEITTATGKSLKKLIIINEMIVYDGKDKNIFNNVYACLIDKSLLGEYQMILHPSYILKVDKYDKIA